jgi:hypothetical protein
VAGNGELRAVAASKVLGVKADKNWEQAEPRQRPSNKAFGPAFPGGTGPHRSQRKTEPYAPRIHRVSGTTPGSLFNKHAPSNPRAQRT